MITLLIVHAGTHETRSVAVEYVCRTYISVRWGQSGIYDLNLKDNVLTARSHAARRKGGIEMRAWSCADIAALREAVQIHCDGEDRAAVIRRLSEAHEQRKADEAAQWSAQDAARAKRIDG